MLEAQPDTAGVERQACGGVQGAIAQRLGLADGAQPLKQRRVPRDLRNDPERGGVRGDHSEQHKHSIYSKQS